MQDANDGGRLDETRKTHGTEADERSSQEMHAAAVVEILQSIRQAEMTPLLTRMYQSEGGVELLDVLMKYL